jgi:predicted HAD superfamily phosphohydrolase YqeG
VTRMGYAIAQARLKKDCLKGFLSPSLQFNRITELTQERLASLGVKLLVLDFDGVLASHGEIQIRADVQGWMKSMPLPICILSNKPDSKRVASLQLLFPQIKFVQGHRKKPYPDSLLAIIAEHKLQPKDILMVDDRVLTGLLAACIAGCQGMWVYRPFKNIARRPIVELLFEALRQMERAWLRL